MQLKAFSTTARVLNTPLKGIPVTFGKIKSKERHTFLLFMIVLVVALFLLPASAVPLKEFNMPHIEDLYCLIIKDSDAQLLALEGGQDLLEICSLFRHKRLGDSDKVNLYLAEVFTPSILVLT